MNMKVSIKLFAVTALVFITSLSFGQIKDCGPKFGKDSVETVRNVGMFNQYYQQKDYVAIYPYWYYLFNNAPCFSKRITYAGAFIGKKYLQDLQKTNPEEFKVRMTGLIDTIIMTYEKRIEFWGEEGDVLPKMADDIFKLQPERRDTAMKLFEKGLTMTGNNTEYTVPLYYMQAAIKEHKRGIEEYSLDSLFKLYFKLQNIVDYNLENNAKEKNKWVTSDTLLAKLMKPYFSCDKIEEFFKPKTDADGENIELLKKVTELLETANCNGSDYALDIAIKLYELEPGAEAAVSIARTYLAKQDNEKAEQWYLKGVEGLKDENDQLSVYKALSTLYYNKGNVSSAKNYANKVLEKDPNNGEAHLIIAWSYVKSQSSCSADGIDGLSVYWAAVDRAIKAKTVDPGVEEVANKAINAYSARFIKQTEAFFKNFTHEEGSTYTVPCLGVTTKVRYNN